MFGDAGDGVRSDFRRSDQRLVVRRPGLGGRKRPPADGEVGLDRAANQAALQKRVAAGEFDTETDLDSVSRRLNPIISFIF